MLKRLYDALTSADTAAVLSEAEAIVRSRLAGRAPWAPEKVLAECGLSPDLVPRSMILLERLAEVLQIDPGRLRGSDRIGDLLRVPVRALSDAAANTWRRRAGGDHVEVFGYDLMYLVETLSDREAWRLEWSRLEHPPRVEDEWIDRMMTLSVGEFLEYFAKTMPR